MIAAISVTTALFFSLRSLHPPGSLQVGCLVSADAATRPQERRARRSVSPGPRLSEDTALLHRDNYEILRRRSLVRRPQFLFPLAFGDLHTRLVTIPNFHQEVGVVILVEHHLRIFGAELLFRRCRCSEQAEPLAPWASRRRKDLLELLDRLNPTIAETGLCGCFWGSPDSQLKDDIAERWWLNA